MIVNGGKVSLYVGASSKMGSLGMLSENSCFDGFRQYMI